MLDTLMTVIGWWMILGWLWYTAVAAIMPPALWRLPGMSRFIGGPIVWMFYGLLWVGRKDGMSEDEILEMLGRSTTPPKAVAGSHRQEALDLITQYGGIDGAHHKQWVLDQVVRILVDDYDEWVKDYEDGEDGPHTYEWDEGIAP